MNELTILNFNIWFDEYAEKERLLSLIACIDKETPDIICLQEVKPIIYENLINKLKSYDYYHYPKNIIYNYGCVIFSKYKISKCLSKLYDNTQMGRELIIAKIDYPCYVLDINEDICIEKVEVVIATSHFESEFNKKTKNINKWSQLEESYNMLNSLYDKYKNVIFCLDTNLTEQEEINPLNNYLFSEWSDAWILKGDDDNKYTFDSKENNYLKSVKSKYRSRLDRMLYKSENCELENYKLIKDASTPIISWIQPSDHFGILGKFEIINVDK
jgi:exonuclease III